MVSSNSVVNLIVDTNFIVSSIKFGINIDRELSRVVDVGYRVVVPSQVVDELTTISESHGGADAKAAKVGKEVLKGLAKTVETRGVNADEAILNLVNTHPNSVVCTNDKNLRKKLRGKGVPVVYIRNKSVYRVNGKIQ